MAGRSFRDIARRTQVMVRQQSTAQQANKEADHLHRLDVAFQKALERRIAAMADDLKDRITQELYAPSILYDRLTRGEPEVTVDDVLNEGLGCGISDELATDWGVRPMGWRRTSATYMRRPHQGDPQPGFDFECYQCGRPITREHSGMFWKDHAGRTVCDLALVEQDMIDTQSYWTDHRPKPFHGEEEDDNTA